MPLQHDPRWASVLRREFADWRTWVTRVVVIAAAVVAGLTVVGFTWLTEVALDQFTALRQWGWWTPLLWTPLCAGVIVWLTRRYAAGAAGSGIPQVMAALETPAEGGQRRLFVSMRLAVAKLALTAGGLLGGLSLGREGPSVQIAAGVMHAARRWLPQRSPVTAQHLLVAGGAAGIAAAFNTPLAGVMFAIEELSRSPEQRSSGLIISAIVVAGLVAVSAFGNATYFGVIHVQGIGLSLLGPGLLVAVASGLAGGLFGRLLLASLSNEPATRLGRWRAARPVAFAVACGLAVALIGIVTAGTTFGSGYDHTRAMLGGGQHASGPSSVIYTVLKFCATWLTAWSGVPGGIFAPSLAIGAALGNDIAALTAYAQPPTLIALGMAGFLAAATQAPLTSFIIVMEMVDGHVMVLTLMACTLIASGVSKVFSRPLYPMLAQLQLQRLPRPAEAGGEPGDDGFAVEGQAPMPRSP